jgi:PKD repeat protein/Tol biopolymer transport system component
MFILIVLLSILPAMSVMADEPGTAPLDATEAPLVQPTAEPTDAPDQAAPASDPTDAPTEAAPTEESTPVPTEAAPTEDVTPAPTDAPEATPEFEVTDEPTPEATPEFEATDEPALEAIPEFEVTDEPAPEDARPSEMSTLIGEAGVMGGTVYACQLDIDDAGDADPFSFTFSAINTQNMVDYQWDLGDGTTTTGQSVSHTYSAVGSYSVSLLCVADVGGTDIPLTGSVTISNTVVAAFSVSPGLSGYVPFTMTLTNTSSGATSFLWEVSGPGGTQTSTDEHPTFTLTLVGTYTVKLTASDSGGQTQIASATVVVSEAPPEADFSLIPISGMSPLNVTVAGLDLGGGPITDWVWDFGDGTTATGQGAHSITYTALGTYWIRLDYTGPGGGGTVMKQVGVYEASEPVDADFSWALSGNAPGGGVVVCFTNLSSGPITSTTWTFGDGQTSTDGGAVVCHTYASEGDYVVKLDLVGTNPGVTSNATKTISAIQAPVAQFTASSGSVQWGDTVNFDSSPSTGIITAWEWDFNNDGTTDSTNPNPSGIPFNTIGGNTVRLTVTGPGGSSYAEMIIIVERRDITCAFTGSLSAVPGTTLGYDGSVSGLLGRAATYSWTVTGPGVNSSFSTEDISFTWPSEGAYFVTFSASTADGASCSESKTVQVQWPELTCSIGGNLSPWPNGSNYAYTATVSNLSGRTVTYAWYVDGVAQGSTTNTLNLSWTLSQTVTVRVVATTTDGSGDCEDSKTVVVAWPALTCGISGSSPVLPRLPDDPARDHDYTATTGGDAGRTVVSYEWWVDGVLQGSTNNLLTLGWDWNQTGSYTITMRVVVDNNDGTTSDCTATRTISVSVPALVCNAPTGDMRPVLNETVTYGLNLGNWFNRTIDTINWTLEKSDGAGGYTVVATGTGTTLPFTFAEEGVNYRIRYSVTVLSPDEGCDSGWHTITGPGVGVDFSCDAWFSGNFNPPSPSANYTYRVTIDNTNLIPLRYTWVLIDYTGAQRTLGTNTSSIDGNVSSPAFSGAAFSPADNYTLRVDVEAVDPADSSYTCWLSRGLNSGTLTVDYTYTVNRTAVEVGQQICLTNTSSTSHGDINALSYVWDFGTADNSLGSQTNSSQQPPCFSYPNPGTYTVKLTGTTISGLRSAERSYTFNVYGSQSLAISRSTATFAPANITFTAVNVNVDAPYTWTFRSLDTGTTLGTRTGKTVTFFFNSAGRYEATVSANGPLGTTTAMSNFELLATDDIRAAFRPSVFGGLAPLHVCFTDRSEGNDITDWLWDFGNGQTLSYDKNNIPGSICTDYTTPASQYTAKLTVTNANGRQATATNIIRTYSLLESSATFTILPQGSGRFCFQAVLSGNISVTGWDFGDGVGTAGPLNYACYTYQSSGSFLVVMRITDGTEDGEVARPVDVDVTTPKPQPNLTVVPTCSAALVASFVITNTGDSMTTPDRVTIRDSFGAIILIDDFLMLAQNTSKTYTVSGYYGTVTLSTLDTSVAITTDCAEPPMLSGAAICDIDGTAVFTISNSSPDSAANQAYEVRDASNALVASGTLTTAANGGTSEIRVSNVYGPLTFTSVGTPTQMTTLNLNTNCAEPPKLVVAGVCDIDGTAVFTVTNNSADTAANQLYEIRDASNNPVASGTLTTAINGGTTEIRVQNIYGPLTFSSTGTQGATTVISASTNCAEPPKLVVAGVCDIDGTAVFTVTNNSADTAANQAYEVRDASNNLIVSGTLTTATNGGTTEIRVPNVYGPLNFSSTGTQGVTTVISASTNCAEPPKLTAAGVCAADGTAVFTVTNSSVDTAANQPYEIRDASSNLITSGMLTTATNGGTTEIRVQNIYGPLTLTSSGSQGATTVISASTDCDQPPVLSGQGICEADGTAIFTITNNSVDTAANQRYEIRGANSGVVQVGMLTTTANGGTTRIEVSGVYEPLTFTTDGGAQGVTTVLRVTTDCAKPALSVSAICTGDGSAVFTVSNASAGAVTLTSNYAVKDVNGTVLQSGTITLGQSQHTVISVTSTGGELYFGADGVGGSSVTITCDAAGNSGSGGQSGSSGVNGMSGGSRRFFPVLNLTPGLPDPSLERPEPWEAIGVGGAVCEDWLLYHTDQTGDWEVFRLGELPRYPQADVNLSQGEGDEIIDMAPTRSPDTEWVAFTSNRDGNWELYITRVDNSVMRRVTYNTVAKDIDPVWSPDGQWIAFETDRDGNWELYLLNLATGEETRLTENAASDINAYWSADSQKIVFQSNRDGLWQIYEIELATRAERRLSDGQGDDHDPAYAFGGDKIAFRSYRNGNPLSVLHLMNADGGEVEAISDPRGEASNHTWYLDDSIIAYQSDADGDLDIYVYELKTRETRLVSDNEIPDYAPTWLCSAPIVVFTSDVVGDPNIFNTPALPIEADPILVDAEANQMTFDLANDVYPENSPTEENASREGNVPPRIDALGAQD